MSGTPDPRYTLRTEWPEVKVYVRWMPDRWALTTWTETGPIIELAPDMGREQQIATLAHELGHLTLGRPCKSFCEDNEREVVAWTARYLIPDVKPLGELLGSMDVASAAHELGLPPEVVLDRLAGLRPAEIKSIAPKLRGETDPSAPRQLAAFARRTKPRSHSCRGAK